MGPRSPAFHGKHDQATHPGLVAKRPSVRVPVFFEHGSLFAEVVQASPDARGASARPAGAEDVEGPQLVQNEPRLFAVVTVPRRLAPASTVSQGGVPELGGEELQRGGRRHVHHTSASGPQTGTSPGSWAMKPRVVV